VWTRWDACSRRDQRCSVAYFQPRLFFDDVKGRWASCSRWGQRGPIFPPLVMKGTRDRRLGFGGKRTFSLKVRSFRLQSGIRSSACGGPTRANLAV